MLLDSRTAEDKASKRQRQAPAWRCFHATEESTRLMRQPSTCSPHHFFPFLPHCESPTMQRAGKKAAQAQALKQQVSGAKVRAPARPAGQQGGSGQGAAGRGKAWRCCQGLRQRWLAAAADHRPLARTATAYRR